MDILEILNYLADKYNFDEQDISLIDEITDQIINSDYEDKEDKDYEDEGEYDYAEEPYDYAEER